MFDIEGVANRSEDIVSHEHHGERKGLRAEGRVRVKVGVKVRVGPGFTAPAPFRPQCLQLSPGCHYTRALCDPPGLLWSKPPRVHCDHLLEPPVTPT